MFGQGTKRIIAVMNQTHDVGKTTITANLGVFWQKWVIGC